MHAKEDEFYQLQLIKIALFLSIISEAQGDLVSAPTNSVAFVGKPNVFTCCSNIQKAIFWKHKYVESHNTNDIYDLNGLVNGFRTSGRFNVTPISSAGCQNLITTNVSRGDEGYYSCTDNEGFGKPIGWELVVLESFDCQESNRKDQYTGANDYDLSQDVIIIVCIVKYFGNIRPKPICVWSSGTTLLDNHHYATKTNSTITLNIHIPATKEIDGDQLSCYVEVNGESSGNPTQAAWKSPHFKISYKEATTTIHSSTHDSTVNPTATSAAGLIPTIATTVLFGFLFLCSTVFAIYIYHKRRCFQQRNIGTSQTPEVRPSASINIGDGANIANVTVNAAPNARSSNSQNNIVRSENRNAYHESLTLIAGLNTNERPCIVIRTIDGLDLSLRSVFDLQQDDVNMGLNNKPLIKEIYTLKRNLMPPKDNLMLSTLNSESQTLEVTGIQRKPANVPVKREPAAYSREYWSLSAEFLSANLKFQEATCTCTPDFQSF